MSPASRLALRPSASNGEWAVVSPHRDDVAFSLGALLLVRPEALKAVVNVFTNSCDYTGDRGAWRSNSDERWKEDQAFFRRSGANAHIADLGLADAPLRLQIPLAAVFQPQAHLEHQDHNARVAILAHLDTLGTLPVGFPMAIGSHVDHAVVRDVGVQRARAGHQVFFYEDLPYAGHFDRESIAAEAQSLGEQIGETLTPVAVAVRHGGADKMQAIAEYRSQLDAPTLECIRRHEARLREASGADLQETIWVTAAALTAWRPVLELWR